jgi:cobalt-precorrin 5A hydrolase
MGLDQIMIVAGIGCRKGASPEEIDAVIASALKQAGLRHGALDMIATAASKRDERGIAITAKTRGVRLVLVTPDDLAAAAPRTQTRSERTMALMGVPSVAESAALAAAGPSAHLLLARIAVGPATCALAKTESA